VCVCDIYILFTHTLYIYIKLCTHIYTYILYICICICNIFIYTSCRWVVYVQTTIPVHLVFFVIIRTKMALAFAKRVLHALPAYNAGCQKKALKHAPKLVAPPLRV